LLVVGFFAFLEKACLRRNDVQGENPLNPPLPKGETGKRRVAFPLPFLKGEMRGFLPIPNKEHPFLALRIAQADHPLPFPRGDRRGNQDFIFKI
jgi:hypothetical protein